MRKTEPWYHLLRYGADMSKVGTTFSSSSIKSTVEAYGLINKGDAKAFEELHAKIPEDKRSAGKSASGIMTDLKPPPEKLTDGKGKNSSLTEQVSSKGYGSSSASQGSPAHPSISGSNNATVTDALEETAKQGMPSAQ